MKNYLSSTIKGIVTLVLISVFSLSASAQLNFSAGQDIAICSGQTANINSTVTNVPNGETVTYSWTSNPGNYQSNMANPTFSNLPVGTYVFTGTATAGVSSVSDQVVVNVSSYPSVSIGVTNSIGLCTGQTVDFSINAINPSTNTTNSPGTTYSFTVSDNPSSPTVFTDIQGTENIQHTFTTSSCGQPAIGNFPANAFYANVVASNACGTTSAVVSPITVNSPPISNFTLSQNNVCVNGLPVTVTNTGQLGSTIGNSASNYACTSTGKFVWTVSPNSAYTVTSGSLGASNGNPWSLWTSGTPSVSLQFTVAGTYTIIQTFANACGQSTVNQTVVVGCGGQTFSIQPLGSQTVCQNVQADSITAVASGTTNLLTYQWYNNTVNSINGGIAIPGATSSSYTPLNNSLGSHYYYCVVADSGNGASVVSSISTVNVVGSPSVDLPADVTSCIPVNHVFSPTVNTNGENDVVYNWDITPSFPSAYSYISGSQSALNPAVQFLQQGTYQATLTVANACGVAVDNQNITVIAPPSATIGQIYNVCAGTEVTPSVSIYDGGSTNLTYNWFVAPGSLVTISNASALTPNISFASSGFYSLNLTVLNECGSSSSNSFAMVTSPPNVILPPAIFGCAPLSLDYTLSGITITNGGSYISSFDWQVFHGDTLISPGSIWDFTSGGAGTPMPTLTFYQAGSYTVYLTATNECGVTSASQEVNVSVPSASLTVQPPTILSNSSNVDYADGTYSLCNGSNNQVSLLNNAPNSNPNGTSYSIAWGSTPGTPSPLPEAIGSNISLTNGNNQFVIYASYDGCSVSESYNIYVGNNPYITASISNSNIVCAEQSVFFATSTTNPITNSSNSPGTTYSVAFSDYNFTFEGYPLNYIQNLPHYYNSSSCGQEAQGVFPANTYNASFVASNICGTTTAVVSPIVVNSRPDANFSLSATTIGVNENVNVIHTGQQGNTVVNIGSDYSCSQTGKYTWSVTPSTGWNLVSGELGNAAGSWAQWVNGASALNISFTAAGAYAITQNFENSCGLSSESQTVLVGSVGQPITIQELGSQTICQNTPIAPIDAILIEATGSYAYQWYRTFSNPSNSGIPIPGATSFTFTPSNSNPGTYYYYCEVTDLELGVSVVSSVSTVIIIGTPNVVLPADISVCNSSSISFSPTVEVNGDSIISYFWNITPSIPSGYNYLSGNQNSSSPTVQFNSTGTFQATLYVIGECGTASDMQIISVMPNSSNLTVLPPTVASPSVDVTYNGGTYAMCSAASNLVAIINNPASTNPSGTTYSIAWGNPVGTSSAFSSVSASNVNLTNGNNYFTVYASYSGCSVSQNYNIYAGSNPNVSVIGGNTIGLCTGQGWSLSIAPYATSGPFANIPNVPGTTYAVAFSDSLSQPVSFNDLTQVTTVPHVWSTSSCGTLSNGIFPSNTFYAQVSASNTCGTTQVSVTPITVNSPPISNFTLSQNNVCVNGLPVTVTNTGQLGSTIGNSASNYACTSTGKFVWTVSPNSGYTVTSGSLGASNGVPWSLWTAGTPSVSLQFNSVGTYTVTQTFANACGQSSLSQVVVVGCGGQIFSIQPLGSQTLCQNATSAAITAVVTGTTDTLSYQWYSNSVNNTTSGTLILGATSSSYSPPSTTVGSMYYYCVVTSSVSGTAVTSATSQVQVNPGPTLTTQPTASNVCVGGTTNQMCIAYANGTGTPVYQWYSNTVNSTSGGTPISGATASCYTPPSITAGTKYYYTIINLSGGGCSSITSNTAAVIITPDPVLETQPTATQTICVGGSSAQLTVALQSATGIGAFTYQWYANTTATNSGGTLISGASSLTYNAPVFNSAGTFYYYCVVTDAGNGCSAVTSQVATVVVVADPTITAQPQATQTLCQSAVPTPLTITASGGAGTLLYQWYSNSANNTTSGTLIVSATSATYTPPTATVGTVYYYCVITTAASGCSVTSLTSTVVVNPGPTLSTQPTSSNVSVGGATNQMCVTYINGTGTAAYQWYINELNNTTTGTAIPGANTNCYTPPSATAGTNYYYSIVSLSGGGCSSLTSNTATVIITSNDTVLTQLIPSQTICVGGTISTPLSVAYSGGNGTPTYQWYSAPFNTPIIEATSSSYTPPVFTTSGTYSYYVVVNVGSDSQTSNTASIIAVPDPTVTISTNSSYCQNAVSINPLSVVVNGGTGAPSYQWYSNTVNSNVGGTAISGATAISYSPSVAATGTIYYYCMISQSGTNCSVNSPTAQIIVTPAPTFTIQPLSTQSVCVGVTTTQLSVAYTNGTGAPSYQWYSNTSNMYNGGVPISAATSSVYTPPTSSAGTTYYYCIVSFSAGGGCSMINSNIAQVIVDPSLCGGNTAQAEFSMTAQGCNPVVVAPVNTSNLSPICDDVTYQWNIASSNPAYAQFVAGSNSSSANPIIQFIEPGNYTVTLTLNSCGSITTTSHQILVATAPTVSIASASSCSPYAYMPGVNVAQADIVSNTPVNSFSWSVNPNVQITNSNSANPTIQFNQSGVYTIGLQVSNICGTGTDQTQVEILGDAISYFQDSDNDSFGNSNVEIVSCVQPMGYVTNGADCNDTLASVNPSAAEIIENEIDENCDGEVLMFSFGLIESSPLVLCSGESFQVGMISVPSGLPNYTLQWYFKSGSNPAPLISNTSGWNIIPGATTSTLTVDPFTGTRTYACFVILDASYGIANQWVSGAKVITYSPFTAQTIIGNPNVIPFNSYNYIVNSIPGHTYNWVVTNGAVASGQGTNNASVMWGQNGPYQVTLTESDGTCNGTSVLFAVNNNCSISVSAASSTTNTFCSGTTLQLQAATAATGITYQWYLNGALIPNETNQNISVSSGGNYQVSINQNGCTAVSNIVSINQLPSAIIPSILVEQANAGCAGGETTLTVSGGTYTNLLWNNGLTASSINVNASGDFSITAIDENGCAVSAGPVSINFSILDPVPICLVTVDEATGKNNVVWEPVTSDLINSYVVLKETNVANVYVQIGTVAYGSNGLFEDVNSNPQVQANRYKLALIDTCGILSSNSDYHKTIHLSTNQGLGNNVNLIWSGYEGFDFGSYNIYRGVSASSMTLLTTIASNLNSYTDINPPVGDVYYMIEVEGVSCDPQRSLVYSHSNILDASVGVQEFTSTSISLYPNPASTSINLQVNTSHLGEDYVVFDAIGKVIYKNKIQSTNEFIQLENFNNGNYFIKVNEVVKRFVVQH